MPPATLVEFNRRRHAKGELTMSESKHARKRPRWMPWAALGAALLVGGLAGGFIGAAINSSSASTTTPPSSSGLSACAVPSVADKVIPSVVTISAKKGAQGGTGSGEVIRSDGYILTNNHVVALAADGGSIDVQFSNGTTAPAEIT